MSHVRALVTALALAAVAAPLAGCGSRVRMRPEHGEATATWKLRQRVHRDQAAGKPGGLDSEEAALIHGRYRESLGGEQAAKDTSSRVLILEDDGGSGRGRAGDARK